VGELHQIVREATYPFSRRRKAGRYQNSLKIARGPTAFEDFHFREMIFYFDHERIPERVVHVRGYGAHGYFETYKSLAEHTCADIFQRAGGKRRRQSLREGCLDLASSLLEPCLGHHRTA